jgi:hypothetical protein
MKMGRQSIKSNLMSSQQKISNSEKQNIVFFGHEIKYTNEKDLGDAQT